MTVFNKTRWALQKDLEQKKKKRLAYTLPPDWLDSTRRRLLLYRMDRTLNSIESVTTTLDDMMECSLASLQRQTKTGLLLADVEVVSVRLWTSSNIGQGLTNLQSLLTY